MNIHKIQRHCPNVPRIFPENHTRWTIFFIITFPLPQQSTPTTIHSHQPPRHVILVHPTHHRPHPTQPKEMSESIVTNEFCSELPVDTVIHIRRIHIRHIIDMVLVFLVVSFISLGGSLLIGGFLYG